VDRGDQAQKICGLPEENKGEIIAGIEAWIV